MTSEKLFRTVLEMQPKETDSGAGTGVSREEKVGPVHAPSNRDRARAACRVGRTVPQPWVVYSWSDITGLELWGTAKRLL